jgi:acyl carrier protein
MRATVDLDAVAMRVRALIAQSVNRTPEQVPLDARLDATQLGIDSLGLIKLGVRLEDAFDIALPDLAEGSVALSFETVRDVASLVARQIAQRDEVVR